MLTLWLFLLLFFFNCNFIQIMASNEVPIIPEILGVLLCIGPYLYIKAIVDPLLTLTNPPYFNFQVLSSNYLSYIIANFPVRAGSFVPVLQKAWATRLSALLFHVTRTACCWKGILLKYSPSFTRSILQSSCCWWIFGASNACEPFCFHFTSLHSASILLCRTPNECWPPRETNSRIMNPAVRSLCPGIWLLRRSYRAGNRGSSKVEHVCGCLCYSQVSLQNPHQSRRHLRHFAGIWLLLQANSLILRIYWRD